MSLKINRLLPMTTINMQMKFEIEIPKRTWLTLRKPCHLQSPETEKSDMAAVLEIPTGPPVRGRQLWRRTGNFLLNFLWFYVYDLRFKAWGPTTFLTEFPTLYGRQAAILKMMLLKINGLLPIYISIVPLKFEVDIQSQSKVRVRKPKTPIWPPGGPFWKWRRWKSIGFCLWPPSTCIWSLKLKFQIKLDLHSGNHVV